MRVIIMLAIFCFVGCLEPQATSRRTIGKRMPSPGCEKLGIGGEADGKGKCKCADGYQLLEDENICALTVCLETDGTWDSDECDCGDREFSDESGCETDPTPQSASAAAVDCSEGKVAFKGDCYTARQKEKIETCETATDSSAAGTWDADNFACDCPDNHQLVSGACQAISTAAPELTCTNSPSGQWQNSECECSYPYTEDEGACIADPQIVGACTAASGTWNSGATPQRCDCQMGSFMIANRCWPCGPGLVRLADSSACVDISTLDEAACGQIPGLQWYGVFNRCAHHNADAIASLNPAACAANGYAWAVDRCFPGHPQALSRENCENYEDLTWSQSLAVCLVGQTEAQYVAQNADTCPGTFDEFLGKCLPRAMPFGEPICTTLGFYWMSDLEAATAAMVGDAQGVCLPVTLNPALSDTAREGAIRTALREYTSIDDSTSCSQENPQVYHWDPDLRVCLPGRLPRTNGALVAPVTRIQCDRFSRHWIDGYGLDGQGKCFSDPLTTISGFHGNPTTCTAEGHFYSQRYLRCFPDNPENPENPRSQDRDTEHLLGRTRCGELNLSWINNECNRSIQDTYTAITTKAACLAGPDGSSSTEDDGFWIDYYKRCFAVEPTDYRGAFGPTTPNDCSTYGLVWSADQGVCLREDIATTARYLQAECQLSGTHGDLPSGDGFLCSQRGYQYWHPGGTATATNGFYPCSSPLVWNSTMRACLPKQNFVVDQTSCEDDLGFHWHDISQNGIALDDIGVCTQQTLAAIRAMDQPACTTAGRIWGGDAVGCLPAALPAIGAVVGGQPDAARRKYIRVCNYYAGLTGAATASAQRTAQQKGWLENFEFCLLEHTPAQLVALAGPTTGQTAAQSACEQGGYSWHVGMNMCVPRAHSNLAPTNDAARAESLSANHCREINFQYDNEWNTCYEANIDFSVGFNAIFRDPGETDAQVAAQCQAAARRRFFWSDSFTSCFPARALNRDCPDNNAQGSAQHIVRDNNQCGAISALAEAECRAYQARDDSQRYLNLTWWTGGGGDRCLVPDNSNVCTGNEVSNGTGCIDFRALDEMGCGSFSTLVWSPILGARRDAQGDAMQGCFQRTAVPSIFKNGVFNVSGQVVTAEEFYEVSGTGTLNCSRNNVAGVVRSLTGGWESGQVVIGPGGGGGPTVPNKLLCSELQDGLEVDSSSFQEVLPSGNDNWASCPENHVLTGACFGTNSVIPHCAFFDGNAIVNHGFKARCHRIKARGSTTFLNVDANGGQTYSGQLTNNNGIMQSGPFAPTQSQVGRHRVITVGCFRSDNNCVNNRTFATQQRTLAPNSQFLGQ